MSWPKYYSSQIIYNNDPQANITIITGWTKKEVIYENLFDENKKKVLAIGNLFSKEGISFIVRNIYLNPKITTLILCGKDLSGSMKLLKDFLEGKDIGEYLHNEIPGESIKKFKEYFSRNYLECEVREINETIGKIYKTSNKGWIEDTIEFPEPAKTESSDVPSEETAFRLEGGKISDLWLKVLDTIMTLGRTKMCRYGEMQRELMNMVTVINDEDPTNPYLPDYLYFKKEDLDNYLPQVLTGNKFEGLEYTYGSRLRTYKDDQIQTIIDLLKADPDNRSAIAFTRDINVDVGKRKRPCLSSVQALIQNSKLYLTIYIRSNDMYRARVQNSFARRSLQQEIAAGVGLPMGKLTIISCSAHIYERDFLPACELLDKHKSKKGREPDPRGYFVIKVENHQIVVNHFSTDNKFLKEFRGNSVGDTSNSQDLLNQISRYISNVNHALDIGSELQKAKIALERGLEYIQDKELKF